MKRHRSAGVEMEVLTMKLTGPFRVLAAAILALSLPVSAAPAPAPKTAELPRLSVDTTYPHPKGKTLVVDRDGNFQAALDAAKPGDTITLAAGATFVGPFTLPAKSGSEWIVVRSSTPDGQQAPPAWRRWSRGGSRSDYPGSTLPPPGYRVDPSYARLMPKLVARSKPVIATAPGAHHYRFVGVEIRPGGTGKPSARGILRSLRRRLNGADAATVDYSDLTLVSLGAGDETSVERLPHHIVFDRCYIHGDPKGGARRGVALNSRDAAVVDSYLADFKAVGLDSQAILGWNGPGPFKIVNNYLEGAGENVMFGGGTPSIRDLVPSDIEIRRNYFYKPLSWKIGDPAYEGTPWTIKNLFELKNARRVRIEGNLFEQSWVHAQDGFAVLLTVRTEDGAVPWAVVEDVVFAGNVVRRCAAGINIMGIDDGSSRRNGRARRIEVSNNLFDEMGGATWGGAGRLFQLLDGTHDVVIDHNTAFNADSIVFAERDPHVGFVFSNNIVLHNEYGIIGTGTGVGHPTIERYFPDAIVRRNVIVGAAADLYPPDNFFPESLDQVGFVDMAAGNYHLTGSSRYKRAATDGGDIGVDFDALRVALGPDLADTALNTPQETRQWQSRLK